MSERFLFCGRCKAPKYTEKEYCCYCAGRYEIENSPFRVRLAYKTLPTQWKLWFVFHLGKQIGHPLLIPEHLRKTDWLDMKEINERRSEKEQ